MGYGLFTLCRKIWFASAVLVLCSVGYLQASDKPSEDYHTDILLFSTKTPYKLSKQYFSDFLDHTTITNLPNHQDEDVEPAGNLSHPVQCKPKQLSVVFRHGARYPSGGDVKRTAKFMNRIQHMNLKPEFESLKSWNNDFTKDVEKTLAKTGAMEKASIAKRLYEAFPQLFNDIIDGKVELISSDTQRTIASAEAFLDGLSEIMNRDLEELLPKISLRNDLLRFFAMCSSYLYEVEENEDIAMAEFNNFKKGPEMKEAAEKISMVMSKFSDPQLISPDDLRSMWVLCGFESALREPDYESPWCDPISTQVSHVLEYTFDLKAFWKKAYGYTINYEQSCPLLSDVLDNMYDATKSESAPGVSLYFGHAETVLPLYALLGLFRDDQVLLSTNYELHKLRRKFRTSLIASFSANIGFVLYDCEQGEQTTHTQWPSQLSSSMVQVMVNEHAVPLPFTDKVAIDFSEFETHYYQFIHHCNFDKLCNNPPPEQNPLPDHQEL